MKIPAEITADWLRARGACPDQLELFRRTFGERAGLTRADAMRAAAAGLEVTWLADILLDGEAWWAFYGSSVAACFAHQQAGTPGSWRAYQEAAAGALCDTLGLE